MSKCKKFDTSLLADYMENRLQGKILLEYEAHLKKCVHCASTVIQCKKELDLMENVKFKPVPRDLLKKGVELAKSEYSELQSCSDIIVQYMSTIVNIIKDTFSVQQPLVQTFGFRNGTHQESRTTLFGETFKIDLIPNKEDNSVELILFLNKEYYKENRNISLYKVVNERIRLISSIMSEDNKLIIPKVKYGKYILEVGEIKVHFSIIPPNNTN